MLVKSLFHGVKGSRDFCSPGRIGTRDPLNYLLEAAECSLEKIVTMYHKPELRH